MYTETLGAPTPRLDQETTEARPERLAFFLRKLKEAENIGTCQRDALWFANELPYTAVGSNARTRYRQLMEAKLGDFESLVQSPDRMLLVRIPAGYKNGSDLIRDFSTEEPHEDMPYRVLAIPTDKITAAKALPYPRKPGEDMFDPVLTMRIIDSGHEQGAWHYFPLASCEFLFYED